MPRTPRPHRRHLRSRPRRMMTAQRLLQRWPRPRRSTLCCWQSCRGTITSAAWAATDCRVPSLRIGRCSSERGGSSSRRRRRRRRRRGQRRGRGQRQRRGWRPAARAAARMPRGVAAERGWSSLPPTVGAAEVLGLSWSCKHLGSCCRLFSQTKTTTTAGGAQASPPRPVLPQPAITAPGTRSQQASRPPPTLLLETNAPR